MPKPYPNVTSIDVPSYDNEKHDRTGDYPEHDIHTNVSRVNIGYFAKTERMERQSGESAGFPTNLGMNNFSFDLSESTAFVGTVRQKRVSGFNIIVRQEEILTSGCVGPGVLALGIPWLNISDIEKDSMRHEAINKCLNRIKDQQANWSENGAEMHKTIEMVTSKVKLLVTSLSSLRKGNLAQAAQALGVSPRNAGGFSRAFARNRSKAVAKQWLELQYGWLPVLSDIYSTLKYFERPKDPPLLRVSATAKSHDQSSDGSGAYQRFYRTVKSDYKVVCYFAPSNGVLISLKQMGLTNPLLLAWELLPFSFVLDWILPVGNTLSTLDATFGVRFVKGCETTYDEKSMTCFRAGSRRLGDFDYTDESSSSARMVTVRRRGLTGFPSTQLPVFKDPLSVSHLLNAIALLRVQLKR